MKCFVAVVLYLFKNVNCDRLRILSALIADEPGAGMDGGKFGISLLGGGKLKVKICPDDENSALQVILAVAKMYK